MTYALASRNPPLVAMQAKTSQAAAFVQKSSVLSGKFKGTGTVFHHGTKIPYHEECSFKIMRKNPTLVVYRLQQDTKHADTEKPMHLEMGVLKVFNQEEGEDSFKAEAGFTHPFPKGTVNEMTKGTLDTATGTLTLDSMGFQRSNENGDNHVTGLRRVYHRDGNCLVYDQYLGVNEGDLVHHLHCELELQQE